VKREGYQSWFRGSGREQAFICRWDLHTYTQTRQKKSYGPFWKVSDCGRHGRGLVMKEKREILFEERRGPGEV